MDSLKKWEAILHVTLVNSVKAHQQPIICLKCEGGHVISASQDHSLKVRCFDLFITEKKTSQKHLKSNLTTIETNIITQVNTYIKRR